MKHRFNTPLSVIRVADKNDDEDLFSDRKSAVVAKTLCNVFQSTSTEKTDVSPVVFIIKKTVGVSKDIDIMLGDEVSLQGRRYLVIDVIPRRHWKEVSMTCEVKGSEHA